MEKKDFINSFLDGKDLSEFTALMVWGVIGFILSSVLELLRHKDKIKNNGGFSLGFWLGDNLLRIVVSLIAIIIGASFNDYLLGIKGNIGALLIGFCTDKIVEALIKFRDSLDISKLFKKE